MKTTISSLWLGIQWLYHVFRGWFKGIHRMPRDKILVGSCCHLIRMPRDETAMELSTLFTRMPRDEITLAISACLRREPWDVTEVIYKAMFLRMPRDATTDCHRYKPVRMPRDETVIARSTCIARMPRDETIMKSQEMPDKPPGVSNDCKWSLFRKIKIPGATRELIRGQTRFRWRKTAVLKPVFITGNGRITCFSVP